MKYSQDEKPWSMFKVKNDGFSVVGVGELHINTDA